MPNRYGYVRKSILLGAGVLVLLVTLAFPKPERAVAGPDDFSFTLHTEHKTLAMGQELPLTALITNLSNQDVLLVPALDGSDSFRYPHVRINITKPENAPLPPPFLRCGNTNDIRNEDFVNVAPLETFEPLNWITAIPAHEFTVPGTYTIEVLYSTDADFDAWRGGFGGGRRISIPYLFSFQLPEGLNGSLKRLLNQVPKMSLKSNTVTVTVVESIASAQLSL